MKCWIAPRNIQPGGEWSEAIVSSIENSKIFVIVLSKNSNLSKHVKREVQLAFEKGIRVIPLKIDDFKVSKSLEYYLSSVHYVDVSGMDENEYGKFLLKKITSRSLSFYGKKSIFNNKKIYSFGIFLIFLAFIYFSSSYIYKVITIGKEENKVIVVKGELEVLYNFHLGHENGRVNMYKVMKIKEGLPSIIYDLNDINDSSLDIYYKADKYRYLSTAHLILSVIAGKEYIDKSDFRNKKYSLENSRKVVEYSNVIIELIERSGIEGEDKDDYMNGANRHIAHAYSIQDYFGVEKSREMVVNYLNKISPNYLEKYPLEDDTFFRLYQEKNNGN